MSCLKHSQYDAQGGNWCSICELEKRIEKLEQRESKEPKETKEEKVVQDFIRKVLEGSTTKPKQESELEEYLQRILCMADEQCIYNAKESSERIRELALKKMHYAINAHKFSGHDSVQTYIDLIKKVLESL